MPNHIINIISIEETDNSTEFAEIQNAVKTSDSQFDFNTIIPMPEELKNISNGYVKIEGKEYTKWREVDGKDAPVSDEEMRVLHEKYGADNWYDWSVKNWNTKWNAYAVRVNKWGKFVFQTAWEHPFPVIEALSRKFPNDTFRVAYADEDKGRNLGLYQIKNGERSHEQSPDKDYSPEAISLAEALWSAELFPDEEELLSKLKEKS